MFNVFEANYFMLNGRFGNRNETLIKLFIL